MKSDFVYFDLGNVLVHFSHRLAAEQMGRVAGVDPDTVWQLIFEGELQQDLETGRIDTLEFVQRFMDLTQVRVDPAELIRAASDIFWLNRSIVPVVSHLAATPVGMGILSNTCAAHWQHVCQRFPLLTQLFPQAILSYEVGAMKPEAAIYRAAIECAGTDPARTLFVDDRPDNVAGAQAAGLDAHLYTSVPQFCRLLAERGLAINY